jgi:hypothetical protein
VARGKGSNQTSLKHRDGFDLFRKLSIGNLVDLFDKVFPQREVKQVSQQMLLMRCPSPGHTDVHPSCYVDARKGLIQCRSCKYTSLNLLQVFQDCSGWSYSEALKQIQAITGVRVVPEKVQAAYEDLDLHREALRLIAWAVNTHLIRMVAPPEGDTAYDPLAQHAAAGALDWLFTRRGHKKDLITPPAPEPVPEPKTLVEVFAEKRPGFTKNGDYVCDECSAMDDRSDYEVVAPGTGYHCGRCGQPFTAPPVVVEPE